MIDYKPPYTINDKILNLCTKITELIVDVEVTDKLNNNPKLRRENRVKIIQASLAIENNTMSLNQVTDIISGNRVIGRIEEILEVKNAYNAYELLLEYDPYNIDDLVKAHSLLMSGLNKEFGKFRDKGVGVFAGEKLVHMAPPANQVPKLIADLLTWIKYADVHPLIKSSVFHYEFEFIHPFADGNG